MGFQIKIIAAIIGIIFFVSIVMFVKKNTFHPNHAVLWILISIFLLSIPFLESFYRWIAYNIIGIKDARHIIYIALIGFLLIYNLVLTQKITQLSDQTKNLISHLAILENKIKKSI